MNLLVVFFVKIFDCGKYFQGIEDASSNDHRSTDATDVKIKCKNPDCNKSYSISKIKWHLSNNPVCKSKYTPENYAELEKICKAHRKKKLNENYEDRKKSVNAPKTLSENLNFCTQIYQMIEFLGPSYGYTMANQTEFFELFDKKVEIDRKLSKAVDDIDKSFKDKRKNSKNYWINIRNNKDQQIQWLNNFVDVRNGFNDKKDHIEKEIDFWQDIWINEIEEFLHEQNIHQYFHSDIAKMDENLLSYQVETIEYLCGEIEDILDPYLPDDRSAAISKSKWVNKKKLKIEVEELLHYFCWSIDNLYKYFVYYVKCISRNITRQLDDDIELPPSIEYLPWVTPIAYEKNAQIAKSKHLEDIICKGCFKKFKENTILKHLNHPKINCQTKYTDPEIDIFKKRSEERLVNAKLLWIQSQRDYSQTMKTVVCCCCWRQAIASL